MRPKLEFLEIDVHQLKKALIIVQHEKFRAIEPHEFILNLWELNSPGTAEETKNLNDLINYFNTVSLWVVTEIVTQPVPKNRTTTIERFIKLAKVRVKT